MSNLHNIQELNIIKLMINNVKSQLWHRHQQQKS